jgi:hypothetical protein
MLEKDTNVFCFRRAACAFSSEKKALSFMRKRHQRLLFLGCMMFSVPAAGQSVALKGPERDFGYTVGDVIVTEATITTLQDDKPDLRSLPVPGPLNSSIELRRADVLQSDAHQTVLRMEYQNFAAPEQVMQAELPGYDIRFSTGVAHVPAWPFHVSPLRVAQRTIDDAAALHGNLPILPLCTRPASIGLLISACIAAMAGCVFAGMQGWLPGIGRKTRPFAAAARRIGKLKPPQAEAALREMLHAFDATAGRHLFGADIDDVLVQHASLADLRAEITGFFDLAQKALFAPTPSLHDDDFAGIARLANALRRAERRW